MKPGLLRLAAAPLFMMVSLAAAAAPACDGRYGLTIRVSVLSSDLPVRTDFATVELRAMAATAPGQQRHQPLGFYKDGVGYRSAVSIRPQPGQPCPAILIEAQLVETDRVIEIARDLQASPCLFKAAARHYRRHADAAYAALNRFALSLPDQLRADIEREMPTIAENIPDLEQRIKTRLNKRLDHAVAAFTAGVSTLQEQVDTPAEVRKLDDRCDSL